MRQYASTCREGFSGILGHLRLQSASCPRNTSILRTRSLASSLCRAISSAATPSSSQDRYVSGTPRADAMSRAVGTAGSRTPSSYRLILARLLDPSMPIATPTFSCDQPFSSRNWCIWRPTTETA